jgi:HEAT repeat protein
MRMSTLFMASSLVLVSFTALFAQDDGPVKTKLEILLSQLKSDDHEQRSEACEGLEALGNKAVPAIPALILIVERDLEEDVQVCALSALAAMPSRAPLLVPFFSELITLREGAVRTSAVRSIGRLGSESEAAQLALVKLLSHKVSLVRIYSVNALRVLGPQAVGAIPQLKISFFDSHPMVRRLSAQTLTAIGEAAVETLTELAKHKDDGARTLALSALIDLGSSPNISVKKLITVYSTLAGHEDKDMTVVAMSILEKILKDATPATIDRIIDTIEKQKGNIKTRGLTGFLNSLSRYMRTIKDKKSLIPMLKKLFVHRSFNVKRAAIRLVRYLNKDALELLPTIEKLAENPKLTRDVIYSLRTIGPEVVPVYLKMLKRIDDANLEGSIIRELGYMRGNAKSALKILKERRKTEKNERLKRDLDRSIRYIDQARPTKLPHMKRLKIR